MNENTKTAIGVKMPALILSVLGDTKFVSLKLLKHNSVYLTLFVCLMILMCSPATVLAQFNDSVYYHTKFTSTAVANNTGNSSSFLTNQAASFSVKKNDVALNSSGAWIYGLQQKNLTNNDVSATLDFNLYKTLPHFYYWGLANFTSSYSLKINNQYQGGLGAAYNIIDKPNAKLNVSDGILYESSDILLSDTVRQVYSTFRNSLRIMFRWNIKEIVTVNGTTFYQNSFSSGDDYIIRSNLGLSVKLNKWLSLTSAFTYNKFNLTKKENTQLTYGLTVEHYF